MEKQQTQKAGKTLVVGLGKTGMSVVRFLAANGEAVAVTDSRDIPPGLDELKNDFPDVARFTGGFDERAFLSADRLVVSPGIALSEPLIAAAIERGIEVIGDIELFARHVESPVVAITGSNGKTTVTTLLGQMAVNAGKNVAVGGNIGTPALDLLADGHDLYVLELSSFQLETLSSMSPVAAVVLNVSEDHMDRYNGLADYAAAKERIYNTAVCAVKNRDDARVMEMAVDQGTVSFGLSQPGQDSDFGLCQYSAARWLCQGEKRLLRCDELALEGDHNLANAMAALALGRAAGLDMTVMLDTLRTFAGLPHRTQFVAEVDGVKYYNDSKATNVGACIAALSGFEAEGPGKSVLILGGDCKDADFSSLTSVLARTCRSVILMGRDRDMIRPHLPSSIEVEQANSLFQAVAIARKLAQPGDRVLLSPACASFDMFRGYEDRGNQFVSLIRELLS